MSRKDKHCQAVYMREYSSTHKKQMYINAKRFRDKKRAFVDEAKNKPCMDCGQKYPAFVMDFDHRKEKLFNIGENVPRKRLVELQQEIAKCDVVCSNCHRLRTLRRKRYERQTQSTNP